MKITTTGWQHKFLTLANFLKAISVQVGKLIADSVFVYFSLSILKHGVTELAIS